MVFMAGSDRGGSLRAWAMDLHLGLRVFDRLATARFHRLSAPPRVFRLCVNKPGARIIPASLPRAVSVPARPRVDIMFCAAQRADSMKTIELTGLINELG
jgi:hypothetical protein